MDTKPAEAAENAASSKVGQEILKAQNAAGKQAKASPLAAYLRPHRTHVGQEVRNANERHHRAEVEEEARKHHVLLADGTAGAGREEEVEERYVVQGLNFDEQRKKRGRQQQDDDRDEPEENDDEAARAQAAAAAKQGLAAADGAGKYFQDVPPDRMGDLGLTDPNDMKRLLGPSVRFAQHAMLLGEDRLKTGIPRQDVVHFLAELYLGVADRAYAQKALREFGHGTGIIDIYPLEVMKHLLEHVPDFFTKVSKGSFFAPSARGIFYGETGKPIVLTYDPALRIRGFALEGGPRPGYLFEPVDPPGTYHLTFQTSGTYKVLVSAISKNGTVAIEELAVEIAQGSAELEDAPTIKRERASE